MEILEAHGFFRGVQWKNVWLPWNQRFQGFPLESSEFVRVGSRSRLLHHRTSRVLDSVFCRTEAVWFVDLSIKQIVLSCHDIQGLQSRKESSGVT